MQDEVAHTSSFDLGIQSLEQLESDRVSTIRERDVEVELE